jgi:hypothetical protein
MSDKIANVRCPQCKNYFALCWLDYFGGEPVPQTLFIRSCPSGGVYDVSVHCPCCNYEEPL